MPGALRPRRWLAAGLVGNALWVTLLMARQPSWPFVVVPSVLVLALVSAVAVVLSEKLAAAERPADARLRRRRRHRDRTVRAVLLATAALGLLLAPAAWSVATAGTAHRGPNVASGSGPSDFRTPPGLTVGSAPGEGYGTDVADAVRTGSPGFRWAAAVVGHRAADLQLASGRPVWALGGYSGHDPHPTVAEFRAAGAAHEVHYLVVTASDVLTPGQSGRIVRWAVSCLPTQRMGPWLRVDLTRVAQAVPGCGSTDLALRH